MVCLLSLHSVGVVTILGYLYYNYAMPFNLFCVYDAVLYPFWFVHFDLFPFSLYVIWFSKILLVYNITWLFVLGFYIFDIACCIYYRDYGLCFGGGSYSSVYVPPPMSVFPIVLIVYILVVFISFPIFLYFVCLFLGSHKP